MEVQVIKAFMFAGKRVEPGSIVDMPVADAAYVIGLKRAERIVESEPVVGVEFGLPDVKSVPPMPPVRRPRKAKADA